MAEHDTDLAEVLAQFTNLIMNERVRAYNEGVDAERERCAKVVEDFPYQMLHMWERPGGPPGNGYRETTHEDISSAIRSPVGG